jgi:hypothetical protein
VVDGAGAVGAGIPLAPMSADSVFAELPLVGAVAGVLGGVIGDAGVVDVFGS